MTNKLISLILIAVLFVGVSGCAVMTTGHASWEVYAGVRTQKTGQEESKVEVQSSVVDKIVDLFTKQDKTEAQ